MIPHIHIETCYVGRFTYSNKMPKMSPCWAMFIFLFPPCVWFLWVLGLPWKERENRAEQNRRAICYYMQYTRKFVCITFQIEVYLKSMQYFWIMQNLMFVIVEE